MKQGDVMRSTCSCQRILKMILPFANILKFYRHAPTDWPNLWQHYSPMLVHFVHLWVNFHTMNLYMYAVNCCVALCSFEIGRVSFLTIYWMLRQARKQHHTLMRLVPEKKIDKKKQHLNNTNFILQIVFYFKWA